MNNSGLYGWRCAVCGAWCTGPHYCIGHNSSSEIYTLHVSPEVARIEALEKKVAELDNEIVELKKTDGKLTLIREKLETTHMNVLNQNSLIGELVRMLTKIKERVENGRD